MKANQDIRERAHLAGVFLWQIADKMGMHDSNFARLLRKELPAERKAHVFRIIDDLSEESRAGGR